MMSASARRALADAASDRRGNAVVEFALLSVPLMAIVLGFFELGRFFFLQESLANAAREGARAAAVRGAASPNPATSADIAAIVRRHAPGFLRAQDVAVTTSYQPDNRPGGSVRVEVAYSYRLLVPWVAAFTVVDIERGAALTISR
jgi:Flp pilus assembly protein TadG